MGQRSAIIVRMPAGVVEDCGNMENRDMNNNSPYLIANWYSWNYNERMISRVAHTLDYIKDRTPDAEKLAKGWSYINRDKLSRYIDVNFDMQDILTHIDLVKEYCEEWVDKDEKYDTGKLNECLFNNDLNDGMCIIDVKADGSIKYAFLDNFGNPENTMSADTYMNWDYGLLDNDPEIPEKDWREYTKNNNFLSAKAVKACEDNIKSIDGCAQLMTKDEVEAFITADYTEMLPQKPLFKALEMGELTPDAFEITQKGNSRYAYMTNISNWETDAQAELLKGLLGRVDWKNDHAKEVMPQLKGITNIGDLPTHLNDETKTPLYIDAYFERSGTELVNLTIGIQIGDDSVTEKLSVPLASTEKKLIVNELDAYDKGCEQSQKRESKRGKSAEQDRDK